MSQGTRPIKVQYVGQVSKHLGCLGSLNAARWGVCFEGGPRASRRGGGKQQQDRPETEVLGDLRAAWVMVMIVGIVSGTSFTECAT